MIYVSGQGPIDPVTGEIVESVDVDDQTPRTLRNVEAILAAADASLDDVVKTTVFLRDMDHYDEVDEMYGDLFSAPYLARSAIAVSDLPVDIDVEVEAIARP